eukprot:3083778-Karenia_brevis.AAC.1
MAEAEVEAALFSHLGASEPNTWEVLGHTNKTGKNFVLNFKGIDGLATRTAETGMQIIRNGGDKVEGQSITGENARVYVGPDTAPKAICLEMAGKRLA